MRFIVSDILLNYTSPKSKGKKGLKRLFINSNNHKEVIIKRQEWEKKKKFEVERQRKSREVIPDNMGIDLMCELSFPTRASLIAPVPG